MGLRQRINPKVELLRNVSLFSACNDRELAEIAKLTDEYDVATGRTIVQEGKSGRECFVIVSGEARVTLRGEELATLGPGSVFGEMSLIDHEPRSATVTAAKPMKLLVIPPQEFSTMLAEHGAVARKILEGLAQRLRKVEAAPTW